MSANFFFRELELHQTLLGISRKGKNIQLKIPFTTLLLPKFNFKLGLLEENSV